MFSPDGEWIAYVSDVSGAYEVYVRPYPGPGGEERISTDGGDSVIWARDGSALYYLNGDKMMAVTVALEPVFRAGEPKELFEGRYSRSYYRAPHGRFDIHPDGKRFLMIRQTGRSEIRVVLNWFEELKRLVPCGP